MTEHEAPAATYVETVAPWLGGGARAWTQIVPPDAAPIEQLHLPRGGLEIRWHRDRPPTVHGPTIRPETELLPPGDEVVGLRFAPGCWPYPAGTTMIELVDSVHPLDAMTEIECTADSSNAADTRLAALLHALARSQPAGDDSTTGIVAATHDRDRPVRTTAIAIGWSERHARRQIRRLTGLPTRDLRRIGRFQRFVTLVQYDIASRRRRSPVELSVAAGYADQSHLQRECRRLAGLTLTDYLDRTHRSCAGHDHPT